MEAEGGAAEAVGTGVIGEEASFGASEGVSKGLSGSAPGQTPGTVNAAPAMAPDAGDPDALVSEGGKGWEVVAKKRSTQSLQHDQLGAEFRVLDPKTVDESWNKSRADLKKKRVSEKYNDAALDRSRKFLEGEVRKRGMHPAGPGVEDVLYSRHTDNGDEDVGSDVGDRGSTVTEESTDTSGLGAKYSRADESRELFARVHHKGNVFLRKSKAAKMNGHPEEANRYMAMHNEERNNAWLPFFKAKNPHFPRSPRVDLHAQHRFTLEHVLNFASAVLMMRFTNPADFIMTIFFGCGLHSVRKPPLMPIVSKWLFFHPFLKKKDDIVMQDGTRRLVGYSVVIDPKPWETNLDWTWEGFRRSFFLASLMYDRSKLGF